MIFVYSTTKIETVQTINLRHVLNGKRLIYIILKAKKIKNSLVFILKNKNTKFWLFSMTVVSFTTKIETVQTLNLRQF